MTDRYNGEPVEDRASTFDQMTDLDLREHLPSIALAQLNIWFRGLDGAASRVCDRHASPVDREADAHLFALALRQVRRSGDLFVHGLGEDERSALAKVAIQTFDSAVPDAKDVRDVLEHFDAYARGAGKLSHPGVPHQGKRDAQASAAAAAQFQTFYERRSDSSYVLHIGHLSVDVGAAKEAAYELRNALSELWFPPTTEAEALDYFGPLDPSRPQHTVLGFFAVVAGELPEALLADFVTPESLPTWSIEEVRALIRGYGLASRVLEAGHDVAYMRIVRGPDHVATINEPTLLDAHVISLVRRPDLDDEWRIHQIGVEVDPKNMPRGS